MNNKKLTMIFILIIALLFATITYVSANDISGDLPILTGNNVVNNENAGANENTNTGNTNTENSNTGNNETQNGNNANEPVTNAPTGNNNVSGNNNTLPTTGVAGDTTLFVFITICIASAVYAYIKIRKYNNL